MAEKTLKVRRTFNLSLRFKLLIAFSLLFSLVFLGVFYWFLTYATNAALENVKTDLVDTLSGAVAGIDGDAFEAMATQGSADDPRYQSHLEWLKTVHMLEPRAFPYTYIRGTQPDEILFIGDILTFVRPEDAASFHDSYISTGSKGLIKGLDELFVNLTGYTDEWGSWISAYRPILDSQGNKVGGMGIDFTTAYVNQVRQGVLDSIGIAFVLTYALLFGLVALISQQVTRPIIKLTRIARAIGDGDYDHDFDDLTASRFPDEVVTLSHVFERMLEKVRGREERLKSQVIELQIIIDENQRTQNVSEIVESDFFRDLQTKAQRARARRTGGSHDADAPPEKPETATPADTPPESGQDPPR